MITVTAYTDGACLKNPGPGGWGVVLRARDDGKLVKTSELRGGSTDTTNNRMELMAAIAALELLRRPTSIKVHSDSKYVVNGITKWIHGWRANGWRTKDRREVKNADLWKRLWKAQLRHDVTWKWIKGHAGHEQNERADELAVEMRNAMAGLEPWPKCPNCETPFSEVPFSHCLEHERFERFVEKIEDPSEEVLEFAAAQESIGEYM